MDAFRTKTGTCTITDERIELARQGARGALAQAIGGSSVWPWIVVYSIAALAWGGLGISLIAKGRTPPGVFCCVLALVGSFAS